MTLDAFRDELAATAAALAAPGTGLLAADESTGTIGKRFEAIGLENSEANRRAYRTLLATTAELPVAISGVILYEETLFQTSATEGAGEGPPIVQLFQEQGIVPGIKVDQGVEPLAGALAGETWCTGLRGLAERSARYYAAGARFAKWRAVLRISAEGCPSELAVRENAWGLARYARTVQEQGLVPIVEPEILMDGSHDIATTASVQEWVLRTVYEALATNGVFLEGSLLKPSMTTAGADAPQRPSPDEVGEPEQKQASSKIGIRKFQPLRRPQRGGRQPLSQRHQPGRRPGLRPLAPGLLLRPRPAAFLPAPLGRP